MNAMEIRKVAQDLGIKNAKQFKKAELEIKIAEIQAERDAAAKAEAKKATRPGRKQSKRCEICELRPATSESPEGRLCAACLEEAEWENTHSDNYHDDIEPQTDDETDNLGNVLANCWICHPELNRASSAYVMPKGSSRVGMTIHVTPRAAGVTKANEVIKQLPAGFEVEVRDETSYTLLIVSNGAIMMTLAWDVRGRFTSEQTEARNGATRRKIRNVSEALRLAK
jgi:hypothetical protein